MTSLRNKFGISRMFRRFRDGLACAALFIILKPSQLCAEDFWEWLLGGSTGSHAAGGGSGNIGGSGSEGILGQGIPSPASVPEIDPSLALSAAVILVCGFLILAARRQPRLTSSETPSN